MSRSFFCRSRRRLLRATLGGAELDVEVVFFGPQTVGSSADPRDVLQTDLYVLNGLSATFVRGAIPTTVTQRCSQHPLTFQTHRHTLSSVFPFPLLSPLKNMSNKGSTTTWRANVLKSDLQANGNVWRSSQDCIFVFIFLSPSPMCAVVDHVECTSIW